MERVAILKKHPERGVWCLFDSEGKALNCWDNRYKDEKPSDEVVQKAEKLVQFYKRQAARVAERFLAQQRAARVAAQWRKARHGSATG